MSEHEGKNLRAELLSVYDELASLRAQVEMGGRVYEAHCDLIAKYERLEVELERLRKGVITHVPAGTGNAVAGAASAQTRSKGHLLLASPTYEQTRLGRGNAAMEE